MSCFFDNFIDFCNLSHQLCLLLLRFHQIHIIYSLLPPQFFDLDIGSNRTDTSVCSILLSSKAWVSGEPKHNKCQSDNPNYTIDANLFFHRYRQYKGISASSLRESIRSSDSTTIYLIGILANIWLLFNNILLRPNRLQPFIARQIY